MDDTCDDGRLIEASWLEPRRFSELFDRHYRALHQFCVRRVGRSEGEDLAGETFCRAFEARRRFDVSRADARPWLYGIALNLVRTHHRGRFRRGNAYARDAFSNVDEVDCALGVVGAVDAHRELDAVVAVLRRLPRDDIDVLLLYVWEQLSYEAIAEVLGVPVTAVRSRLFRVRKRLREATDRDEPAPEFRTAAAPFDNRRSS